MYSTARKLEEAALASPAPQANKTKLFSVKSTRFPICQNSWTFHLVKREVLLLRPPQLLVLEACLELAQLEIGSKWVGPH